MVGVAQCGVAIGHGHRRAALEELRRKVNPLLAAIEVDQRQIVDRQDLDGHRLRLGAEGRHAAIDRHVNTRLAVLAAGALIPGPEDKGCRATIARRGHETNARRLIEQDSRHIGYSREGQPARAGGQRVLPDAVARHGLDDGHALQRVAINIGDEVLALLLGALDDALDGTATGVELVFEDRRQDHLAAVVEHRCIVDGIDQHLADGRQADERAVAHGDLN